MTELTPVLEQKQNGARCASSAGPRKFGTFLGVFVPAVLMLFGVIIFLRLGWIVGVAGLPATLIVITLATLIALITMLSMSAIATNIEVKAGGMYYIISRSLGIEVGSAVGLPLFLKQALTIAFCVIGFAESLKELIPSWDITWIGIGTLAALAFLAYTSVSGAMKVQMAIFVAIILSLISLFTGSAIVPVQSNSPGPLHSPGFWVVFAIFFPAMTGVESSVSLSGDLRDPGKSLPLGTISAILVGFFIYAGIATFLAWQVPQERLAEDPLVMQYLASFPSLIVVGIWGATLSSALGGLLGAPRMLQAIAEDGIAPRIFRRTFGPMQEPRIATLATCAIAFLGIYFGSVNQIAPLLTMITLICYGVLNLSAGIETLIANPSWRPRVPVHWAISFSGAILCLIAMLMISPGYALISLFLVGLFYGIIRRKGLASSLADIQQGILLFFSRSMIYRLTHGSSAAKSWRPHFLVFAKFSEEHSTSLIRFSEAIGQNRGFLTAASFVPPGMLTPPEQREMQQAIQSGFQRQNIKSFVSINEADSIIAGMKQMIEYYGFGPLVPNTLLLGGIKKENETAEFAGLLQSAFAKHYNIVIMNDDNKENTPAKEIHLWWDHSSLDNSSLMLVLAHMLQSNPNDKNKQIVVKAVVPEELQRDVKMQELQQLGREKRLCFQVDVYVSSPGSLNTFDLAKEFSKEAQIVLVGLAPPPKQEAPVDGYIHYLHTIAEASKALPSLVLVSSSEHTPLKAVLQ
jgi:amino acid transporter